MVARLATSEFLIESVDGGSERVNSTRRQLAAPSRPTNVYPVARQDMVVGIQGPGIQTLLRQICSVDFVPLFESSGPAEGPIALTSMVGVGVVAWPRRTESGPVLRVWLDPSFAHYFWTTLLEVGRGVGALVIGSNT
jgi:sarcosine oxidase gamma subunit